MDWKSAILLIEGVTREISENLIKLMSITCIMNWNNQL